MNLSISPQDHVCGDISLPGDKSIAHRLALLAAFADGVSCLHNFPSSQDCRTTLRIISQLGAVVEETAPGTVRITGCNGTFRPKGELFDCGNSGTTARLLMGLLAGQSFEAVIDGDESLRKRPMEHIAAPLREMGAEIVTFGTGRTLPLWMKGRPLQGKEFVTHRGSAQLKSALLLAGIQATGSTFVSENPPSRDHTERAMQMAGIRLATHAPCVGLTGKQIPHCFEATIPGDISSGAFWLAWAAAQKGSRMILRNVGLNPGRLGFVDALLHMGAGIREEVISCGEDEWFGNLDVRGRPLRPVQISAAEVPALVDEIPILAVLAAKAQGATSIRGAASLRDKETDRIAAVATNLKHMGVDVEELPDGMVIYGSGHLRGAEMDSFGDHRIAMAFAIAGLLADEGESLIRDADCIAVSYPEFQEALAGLLAASHRHETTNIDPPLARMD